MNEKNYLIQFKVGKEIHNICNLSHHDFSKGTIGDKLWVNEMIKIYNEDNHVFQNEDKVEDINLFGKQGEIILHADTLHDLLNPTKI